MKSRSALVILTGSLILGSAGPVFAVDSIPSRLDQVTSIQNQYNPIFDGQYTRLVGLKAKVLTDANMLRTVKATLLDFVDMRRVIDSGLVSSISDLVALKDFADEEQGEFGNRISAMEIQAAKNKTISCRKGKVVKKFSALAPKCPTGYKKK